MKMMQKSLTISLIFLLALIIVPFVCTSNAHAENTDLIIDLDKSSKFDMFNDILVYTSANSLYVAKDNEILSLNNAFSGKCVDVVINEDNILLLQEENLKTSLCYYSFNFDSNEIKKENDKVSSEISSYNPVAVSVNQGGTLCYVSQKEDEIKVFKFKDNDVGDLNAGYDFNKSNTIADFYIDTPDTGTSYAFVVSNNKLLYKQGTVGAFAEITSLVDVSSIAINNTKIYANTASGIYVANLENRNFTKLGDSINGDAKIVATTTNGSDYLFLLDELAIVQYSILDSSIEYFNKFDNSAFTHPTDFNLLNVAKVNENIKVYSSPKNLQLKSSLVSGDYIVILCRYEDTATNNSYYYICTSNNELGYIKSDSKIVNVNTNTDPSTLKIGYYAQGLHETTTIYKYPYSTSEELVKVDRFSQLVVVGNVGEVDGVQVWDYYKVSIVIDGKILTGYVKVNDVSPYCSLKAPQVLKNVKAITPSVGATVQIYTLPSEDAPILDNVVDGTSLELAEEYNADSEWTKIVYNDTFAYVKTASIQKDGLTSLQITVIVISVIVFISTITMIAIIVRRRRFGY